MIGCHFCLVLVIVDIYCYVCDQGTALVMTDRRKQQNFLALHHYLTEELWNSLREGPREKAEGAIWRHCWQLGLRCPSEATFALVLELLRQGSNTKPKDLTIFEKYNQIVALKTNWRKLKLLRRNDDFKYQEYMEQLPLTPTDLPAEWYLQAFPVEAPVPCRTFDL